MRRQYDLYLLVLPGILFLLMFKYFPLLGNVIAFQDFRINIGRTLVDSILKSEWVGWRQFERIFRDPNAWNAVRNTFIIAGYKIVFLFPIPIVLAILLNEMRLSSVRRVAQTIIYFPNFLSWVVVGTMFAQMLQADGLINTLLGIPFDQRVSYLIDYRYFRPILVLTEGWKSSGFATIIYLAAISGIDPGQFEAATVDGCNRFQRIRHVTIPNIGGTIAMVFVISLGIQVAYGSFEQVLILSNPAVYETGDILQTFSYRKGLGSMEFSFSTAAGMLNATAGLILIFLSNYFCKKAFGRSIW